MKKLNGIRVFLAFLASVSSAFAGHLFKAQARDVVVPNQYLVRVHAGTNASIITSIIPDAQVFPLRNGLSVVVTSDSASLARLAQHPGVDFAEPNRARSVNVTAPNDPNYSSQWALQTVQAVQAWTLIPDRYLTAANTGNQRTKVALIDTGVDCTHPDFKNAGGSSTDSAQGGQLDFALSQALISTTISGPSCSWQDDFGHGTATAGILAAATQNGTGVAGLGYPLDLIVFKALNSSGSGDDGTIANAIMAAADAGARVISLSLGGPGYSQALQSAIAYAFSRDALVVAAAGNDGNSEMVFPGNATYAIAVAATDQSNNRASFSNFGNFVGLAAPGVSIVSTVPTYTVPIGVSNYASLSGTSAATPFVSAVAGLLAMTTPNTSAAAIMQRLQQTAVSMNANGGWSQDVGYGVVNAYDALSATARPSTLGSIVGQVKTVNGLPVTGATVSVNGSSFTTDASGLYRIGNLAPGTYTITASGGGQPTQSLTAGVVAGSDTLLPIVMGANYASFSGTVVDNGAGVPGAIVQSLSGQVVQATAVADPNGQYRLWVPNGGTYDIRATAVARQTAIVSGQSSAGGGNTAVSITLPRMGTISGTVLDGSSNPVANAQVFVSGAGMTAGAVTDGSGRYTTIGLPSGSYNVSATASGLPDANASGVAVGAGATTVNLRMGAAVTPISVSLAPGTANLGPSQTQQFTATVTGASNPAVTWTLSPQVGIISAGGLYQAPSTITSIQIVTVTATSVQDTTKSASAVVTLNPPAAPQPPPPPSTGTITGVTPAVASIQPGQSQQYTAYVNGAPTTAVQWSVSPAIGSMSATGLYTAPGSVATTQLLTIQASNGSSSVVTIAYLQAGSAPQQQPAPQPQPQPAPQPPPPPPPSSVSVILNRASVTLTPQQSFQFAAAVSGTSNTAVTWSLDQSIGSLDQTGFYTAPAAIPFTTQIRVKATSVADPTQSAVAIVTLSPSVTVSISPNAVSAGSGQTRQFSATVSGTPTQAVHWWISPNRGTVDQNGLYTAPTDVSNLEIVTITATSIDDPNVSTSTFIMLQP